MCATLISKVILIRMIILKLTDIYLFISEVKLDTRIDKMCCCIKDIKDIKDVINVMKD